MTQPHHRNRHPKYLKKYKIHNWRSYEQSLINRGDLTLWLSEDVIESWNSDLGQRMGRPKLYSDLAIETALTLRLLFKLPLRQTEGFLKSNYCAATLKDLKRVCCVVALKIYVCLSKMNQN